MPGARAQGRAWRVVPGEDGAERGGRWGPGNGDKAGCGAGEWRGAALSQRVLGYQVAARGTRRAERARGGGLQGAGAGRRVVRLWELSCGRRGWAELGQRGGLGNKGAEWDRQCWRGE